MTKQSSVIEQEDAQQGNRPREKRRWMPDFMTEDEVIEYLRIPWLNGGGDGRNALKNLIRMHGLPRVHICNKNLYPKEAVREWMEKRVEGGEACSRSKQNTTR